MGTEGDSNGPAASTAGTPASTTTTEKNHIWSLLPSFDPQSDDAREYKDKAQFIHSICPPNDRAMLAPRLAMLMKGTAWAQVKTIDASKLVDPENGVKTLLKAIATWEEAEELQTFDRFEKAIYKTTQRPDETTQSYVNRLTVAFHEIRSTETKDIRAFILLRQSALTVEDKKRVLTMTGQSLTSEKVEAAMRQLSTKVLLGQNESKKKVYPVNYMEDENEDHPAYLAQTGNEEEGIDEETWIQNLADQGDEDANLVLEFEEQLIEVCQENQDLATCYSAYADARAKIHDRLRNRGFWPVKGKGKGKSMKKGMSTKGDAGRLQNFMNRRRQKETLAERIANSHCRKCGAKGHWKWECPQRDGVGNKDDANVNMAVEINDGDEEILDALPHDAEPILTVDDMYQKWDNKDRSPPLLDLPVNEEFVESAFICSHDRQKVTGHGLGSVLLGALARRTCGHDSELGMTVVTGCPGIIDAGASKTVIGQRKVKALIQSMPDEIQRRANWKSSQTVFRFGNNAVLPSVGALYLPFGSRWMRIEVVRGDTPFLLSNSFLKAIDADVCTSSSELRLNGHGVSVPLTANAKGLFTVELSEVIAAIDCEHVDNNIELVTTAVTETDHQPKQEQQSTAAKVAQSSTICDRDSLVECDSHDVPDRPRHPLALSRECRAGIHDARDCPAQGSVPSTGSDHVTPVGNDEATRRKTSWEDLSRSKGPGHGLCGLHASSNQSDQRVGTVFSGICSSMAEDRRRASARTKSPTKGHGQDNSSWQSRELGSDREGGEQGQERLRDGASGGGSRDGCGHRRDNDSDHPSADCNLAGQVGDDDQESEEMRRSNCLPRVSSKSETSHGESCLASETQQQVINRGHEILKHLEVASQALEEEVAMLVALTKDINLTRRNSPRMKASHQLDLLEVYCEPNSNLTKVALAMGLQVKRFSREDGDLATPAGREALWRIVETEKPRNIWVAPACKAWGNFSRWNSGRSPATAERIQAERQSEKQRLSLCQELYWRQIIHGYHFHLEQPVGSEAMDQKELRELLGEPIGLFSTCVK